ncbi:MAG: sigma-70 family RNA polymerase sigma factor [Turneriella sp.]
MDIFADQNFRQFFDAHALALLRYARSRVYDRDDAEDLCSEAWLRFYEGYREPSAIRTTPEKVLFGILRNLAADYYKKKKQVRTALLLIEEKVELSPSTESEFIWREFEEHVVACLFALKDSEKLAWLLKFDPSRVEWIAVLSGKPVEEIRSLHRQSASREIFIDEAQAAALMHRSVWSFRRKYEKAQKIMNNLMRKNNWGDLLDGN